MIARIWHGVTQVADANDYLNYINQTGIPDYRATPGNRGAFVFRRMEGDQAHFLTLSLWDSIESVKQFAGTEYDRARYYPEDEKYLKQDAWNEMKIKVVGDELTSWLNGHQMVQLKDEKIGAGKGFIALQIHDGGGIKVRWKDLEIQELDAH